MNCKSLVSLAGLFLSSISVAAPMKGTCQIKMLNQLELDVQGQPGQTFEIPVSVIEDETNVFKLTPGATIAIREKKLFITGAVSNDDECSGNQNCRWILMVAESDGHKGVSYANHSSKIGVMTPSYKISCRYVRYD